MNIEVNKVLLNDLHRVGNINDWLDVSGAVAIDKALKSPKSILSLVKEANLPGLGGSGFPAFIKWDATAKEEKSRKYLICNGNEDEPGTYKDRLLMEEAPHQIIEGALVAAITCGITHIVFYINPHLKLAIQSMTNAVEEWDKSEVFKKINKELGFKLNLRIKESSGLYIGGEETAAIETVEGKFPFPRGKPPYPAESGVFGCPTLINNMETLSNVSHLVKNGAKWYEDLGIAKASGTKIFSLSGDVLKPGVYELPMGTPLKILINDIGGGMLLGKTFKAVFMGGPSNSLLTEKDLDVPLDFESVMKRKSHLGTGAVIVLSEGTGIVGKVAEYVSFFEHSSCGQCPPCKSGTFFMSSILNKIDQGVGTQDDLKTLRNLCNVLPGSGKCHLVNGAVKVVESSLYHFEDEYTASLVDK